MKRKTILFLLGLLFLVPLSIYAYGFQSDGLFYDITSSVEPYTVAVSGCDGSSNVIVIPAGVTWEGVEYSVTSIGERAFVYKSDLTSITIPESVTSIGENAFNYCVGLTSLTVPNGVTSIENWAFEGVLCVIYSGSAAGSPWGAMSINGHVEGNLVFESEEKTHLVGCPRTATGDIVIPNSVTTIGDLAFSNCYYITSITIPESVTSIGDYAICWCTSLTSITIPNSVTHIGKYAFSGSFGLSPLTVPESVTSIDDNAFYEIFSVIYSGSATGAPWGALAVNGYMDGDLMFESEAKTQVLGCVRTATGEIVLPNSVTSIGDAAFSSCSGLTSIIIPDGVTSIGDRSFFYCSGLTSITIPDGVTSIGESTFSSCSGLTSIVIPAGVTSIGNRAFSSCSGLTSITIPAGVTSIGDRAFSSCSGLTSITIPNGVSSIGDGVFEWCDGLISISIGDGVTSIGEGVFYACPNLMSINVENGNSTYDSRDNCNAVVETFSNTLIAGCKNTIIPKSITSIGNRAFLGCSGLTSIAIPDGVTSIGDYAFSGCSGLTSITIPDGVTSIGDAAFFYCFGLTSITISENVTSIGGGAFEWCFGLTSITCLSLFPPQLGEGVFSGIDVSIPVQIPCASLEAYQAADGWSSFENFQLLTPTFTVQSSNPEWGYVQTEGEVESCGDMITISAIPMPDYSFVGWSDGNTDNPRTLEVTQDMVLTAEFEVMGTNTSFDAATAAIQDTRRILRNGQVFILRDGKTYNLLGQEVR